MPFQIIRDDITKVKADAIVNTANPNVAIGAGVDYAIYQAAGEDKLLSARAKIGELEPGEVGITPGFNLGAKYIIHSCGPWWNGGNQGEAKLLKQCYDRSLKLAYQHRCRSIAFPLLATGTNGFPQKLGIEIAVDSFTRFLTDYEMDIFLVVFGQKSVKISGELGEEVRSFIDDDYVEQTLKDEYELESSDERRYERPSFDSDEYEFRESSGPTDEYDVSLPVSPTVGSAKPYGHTLFSANPVSLDDALKNMYTDSFEKHLQQLINKKGLKNSEVYAAANISKQYFSKLLKGQVKPSKEKVLALAVGLKLNMDEAVDFLRFAGYALSPVSQTDVIVEYFIRHEDYNVMKIDIVLFDYGLEPLSS